MSKFGDRLIVDGGNWKTRVTKTDHFCPNCGEQEIWEDDCDDYYQSTGMHCTNCSERFQSIGLGNVSEIASKIKEQETK